MRQDNRMSKEIKQNLNSMAFTIICTVTRHHRMMQKLMETLSMDDLSLAEKLFGYNFFLTHEQKESVYEHDAKMSKYRLCSSMNSDDACEVIDSISKTLNENNIVFDDNFAFMYDLLCIFNKKNASLLSVVADANTLEGETPTNEEARALTKKFATTSDPCNFMFTLLTTQLCDGYKRYQTAHAVFLFLHAENEDAMKKESSGRLSAGILFPTHAMTGTLFFNPFEQKEEETTAAAVAGV